MRTLSTALLVSALALSACTAVPSSPVSPQYASNLATADSPFIQNNYAAANSLIAQAQAKLSKTTPIIVATLVNIDDLNNSSTFGRLSSEQVSAKFSQSNYTMIEMKFRGYVYMKQDQGELLLTREIRDVAQSHNAQAVIVGTYALGRDTVFVNLKLIQPNTNVVMAVHDYTFPLDNNVASMTRSMTRR